MGNALVVDLVKEIGNEILKIIKKTVPESYNLRYQKISNKYFPKLQYQFVHFFVLTAKISALDLKYMTRLGLAY